MYPNAAANKTQNAIYVIAAYLRLSDHDDTKDESNSIKNQREIIKNYVASQSDFSQAKIVEYIDDGVSGSHTQRAGYQHLMGDVKRGLIHCIVVKDLSRIGRNSIDVDDLLMNHLVIQDVRFIAIGDRYDSLKNPLSNLELAFINLTNQHYARDLAQKSISSRRTKMKRGEFLSCWAIFGYEKSTIERNKIVVDKECAEHIRLIFSLAASGTPAPEIAKILNAQGVPTPGEYKKKNGTLGGWKTLNPENSIWNNSIVCRILSDIRYTGTACANTVKIKHPGTNRCLRRPKDEWILVPDAHEAIVTKEEYDKAREALQKCTWKDPSIGHIFHGKIKCPICNYALIRLNPRKPYFKCNTRRYSTHYDCPECTISQKKLEKLVLESIKVHAAMLIEQEELKLATLQQSNISRAEAERKLASEQKAVRVLESSVTGNITAMISGKISQEVFLHKKETINCAIAQKNAEIQRLYGQLEAFTKGTDAVSEKLSELQLFAVAEKLNRELVDLMVDKIWVHSANDIQIVWIGGADA